jgi:hypothetical protein
LSCINWRYFAHNENLRDSHVGHEAQLRPKLESSAECGGKCRSTV